MDSYTTSPELAPAMVTSPSRETSEANHHPAAMPPSPTNKPSLPTSNQPMATALPAASGHPAGANTAMNVDSAADKSPQAYVDVPAQTHGAEKERSNGGQGGEGDNKDMGEVDAANDNDSDGDDDDEDTDSDDDSDAVGPDAGPTTPSSAGPKPSSGSTALSAVFPLSRVRRVIKEDRDISMCQSDAVVAIALAAQLFVEELAKQGQEAAQASKRKTVAYKDLAKAVSETDRLEFLSDLIPPMLPYKKALEKRKRDEKTMAF
ncbi:hypothetical protein H4R34_000518 [Dimargaris verticillata]|uniref:Transcription factor CBF/NF-Y/archaeal histone domain-containing protein n=1 Tax=Dimargaris verticillata TaxID=2761393 RepID=A0A9W8EBT8_9FUNG|nr:hypothetical protein H4R34_000518 [Dimargaris verticillata]